MLLSLFHTIEKGFDKAKYGIKKKFDLFDPVIIYPYRSYGYNGKMYLRGRVLEKERVIHDDDVNGDSTYLKLSKLFRRFESDEIPNAELEVVYKGEKKKIVTDEDGFYQLTLPYKTEGQIPFWDKVDFRLLNNPVDHQGEISGKGEVMLLDGKSDFGIISDVDDTIIESSATSPFVKFRKLAFSNAQSRVAFPGVAAFYKALIKEKENRQKNPLWYVSGSSWNLYDLLDKFCEAKNIPRAPFLLRNKGLDIRHWVKKETVEYKLEQIRPVIKLMDELPFILIGDSGQKDPEVYEKVVELFPDRILAIYIRDVSDDKRDKKVKEIAKRLDAKGVDMILAKDSFEAAKHAFSRNWISEEDLNMVKQEVHKNIKEL